MQPILRNPDGQWDHDMFEEDAGASLKPNTGIETGTKLFISNLDFGVSNEDIKVAVFSATKMLQFI